MKNLGIITAGILAISLVSCTHSLTSYVDPSIGTGGHGHVFVGANVPFGAVQLGPTSIPQSWDWCSGYHESDVSVIGFSHTHLSGTGIGDLFDVTLMPVTGRDIEYTRQGIASDADRSKEVCVPGYYSVPLVRYGVTAEMTATNRVGFHRYSFNAEAKDAAIVIDLKNGGCWDAIVEGGINVLDNTHITGWRRSKGWAKDQKIYFCAEFEKAFESVEEVAPYHYRVNVADGVKTVLVKVAISPNSVEGAEHNLLAELPGWDFEATKSAADKAWEAELSKIRIKTADESARRIFYTAMYHTMVAPSLFCDEGDPDRYTTLSLWDTYRAAMPLYTVIHADRMEDMMQTFLDIYNAQGKLPVWHLHGNETNCMVGNPGVCVVADALSKGFGGAQREALYQAAKASSLLEDRGQGDRMMFGYLPCDRGQVYNIAYDLEYAIADWALAQVAGELGSAADQEMFLERSRSYKYHFDPKTRFIRAVDSKGAFKEPFNPFFSDIDADDYCEGNAWQYTWLVPHDLQGLSDCFGGRDQLMTKLDSLFTVSSEIEGEHAAADISGLIGQYAHGNEPSHHTLYFYQLLGEQKKATDLIRKVCKELYFDKPDGLSGNEDVGQMSAWYILSTIGLYQVEPAGGRFVIGAPQFDNVKIAVAPGKTFEVRAKNLSDQNCYIESVKLNGKALDKVYVDYSDIMAGGVLEFTMSSEPGEWFESPIL